MDSNIRQAGRMADIRTNLYLFKDVIGSVLAYKINEADPVGSTSLFKYSVCLFDHIDQAAAGISGTAAVAAGLLLSRK